MDDTLMTEEERQAYVDLCLLKDIELGDPKDVDPEFARNVIEKAKILQNCKALDDDLRRKLDQVAKIFSNIFPDVVGN